MKTQTERVDVKHKDTGKKVGYHEYTTVEFRGRSFTAGGAHVDPKQACGYPQFDHGEYPNARGVLKTASGNFMGACKITAQWRTPRSHVSSHMYQIDACIGGVWYTGRGGGSGMSWKGKRKK